jgi:hypothetical protein
MNTWDGTGYEPERHAEQRVLYRVVPTDVVRVILPADPDAFVCRNGHAVGTHTSTAVPIPISASDRRAPEQKGARESAIVGQHDAPSGQDAGAA